MHRSPPCRTEDFAPISPFRLTPLVISVHPSSPIRDFATLMAAARTQDLAHGTSGSGASSHLLMERLRAGTGARFVHAPCRGEAPAATDVIGGRLPLHVGSAGSIMQRHLGGLIRSIATTAPERQPALPDIPTSREQGRDDLVFTSWHGRQRVGGGRRAGREQPEQLAALHAAGEPATAGDVGGGEGGESPGAERRLTTRRRRTYNPNLFQRGERGDGAPGRIRTLNLQIRSLALYPVELRAHPAGARR